MGGFLSGGYNVDRKEATSEEIRQKENQMFESRKIEAAFVKSDKAEIEKDLDSSLVWIFNTSFAIKWESDRASGLI